MTDKEKPPIEEVIKYFNKEYKTQFGEHFINFVIKQEKFDFNAFKTQEELERYLKDSKHFAEYNDEKME